MLLTIFNFRHVLTAAHCVKGDSAGITTENSAMRFGIAKLWKARRGVQSKVSFVCTTQHEGKYLTYISLFRLQK